MWPDCTDAEDEEFPVKANRQNRHGMETEVRGIPFASSESSCNAASTFRYRVGAALMDLFAQAKSNKKLNSIAFPH
jgi:hypothetical protein